MKAITRMRKIGGSLMITIPKEIVKEEALKEGQIVEVEIKRIAATFSVVTTCSSVFSVKIGFMLFN